MEYGGDCKDLPKAELVNTICDLICDFAPDLAITYVDRLRQIYRLHPSMSDLFGCPRSTRVNLQA